MKKYTVCCGDSRATYEVGFVEIEHGCLTMYKANEFYDSVLLRAFAPGSWTQIELVVEDGS